MTDEQDRPGHAFFDLIGKDKAAPAFLRVAEATDRATEAAARFDAAMTRIREQACGHKHGRKPKRRV